MAMEIDDFCRRGKGDKAGAIFFKERLEGGLPLFMVETIELVFQIINHIQAQVIENHLSG